MDKIKKGFWPYDRQPRKNLHTAISVNKPKLSVTKHDQKAYTFWKNLTLLDFLKIYKMFGSILRSSARC